MPEDDCFIPGMDAVSFTSYMGELSGMPRQEAMKRAHEVLYYVGLEESRYRLLETYSAGMRQRLKLAQSIVHDPKLIFLDEPTSGLDPQGRKEILELIMDISSKKDIQVLISSHILPDIEQTCAYVVILNKGEMAADGQISELKEVRYSLYEMKIKGEEKAFLDRLAKMDSQVEQTEDKLLKVYLSPGTDPQDIFKIAVEENVQVRHFVKSQTSLEDLFAKVVGVD
jgi:ABC-2 type transport system ATP-binding protein